MVKYNKDTRVWEEKFRREVLEAENNYIIDPTPGRETIWLEKQQEYKIAIMQNVETK